MLSEFQTRKLTYFFGLLDLNKNGFLQLSDFTEISERIRQKLDYNDASSEHKFLVDTSVRFFHRLLADIPHADNQVIKLQEWLEFFDAEIISSREEDVLDEYVEMIIGFLFDLFDDNHDGYISVEEYADIFLIYGIDIKYSAKAFIKLDLNQDDKLSRYELLHAVETFLTSDEREEKGNWVFGNWEGTQPD